MGTWFRDATRGRGWRWHLEEGSPDALLSRGVCGRILVASEAQPIQRREGLEGIPEAERCPVCEDVAARLTGPPARMRVMPRPPS